MNCKRQINMNLTDLQSVTVTVKKIKNIYICFNLSLCDLQSLVNHSAIINTDTCVPDRILFLFTCSEYVVYGCSTQHPDIFDKLHFPYFVWDNIFLAY